MLLYGCSALGVNLLNTLMGSYLCSALLIGGFGEEAIKNQTFTGSDLVIPTLWALFVVIAKAIDGIIDIPMASITDNLKSRFGRRRPAILAGLTVLVLSFTAFTLFNPQSGATILNTIYYGVMLCIFYTSYTLTMVTYYATFTEIVDNESDRNFISNVKSVCDIVYFIIGYVLVGILLNGINIRIVAMIMLPLVLFMLIPLLMIKEPSTLLKDKEKEAAEEQKQTVNVWKSLAYTFKNKDFIAWMGVYSLLTFGVQLFLGGINEYFSYTGMSMIYTMTAAFVPVPFTLIIYNKLIKKKGFRFAIQYVFIVFAFSMLFLFGVSFLKIKSLQTFLSIVGGGICSFSVGALFSVAYSIPSQLAAEDEARTKISHSAMYFAVQGLFSGVATGIGTGAVLTLLKQVDGAMTYMTLIAGLSYGVAFALTYILPKSIVTLGKEVK